MVRKSACFVIAIVLCVAFWAHADTPVTIGVSLGLTGRYAKMANMQEKGFRLWADQVNQKGGLLGRPVQLIIYDDRSDRATAKRLYNKLLVEDGVDLLFTPYSSGLTAAIAPIIEQHRCPVPVSGASSDKIWEQSYRYLFGVYIPASRYAVGFLEMSAMHGHSKVAILHADDTFSTQIGLGTKSWAKKFGLDLVLFRTFAKGKTDFSDLASAVKHSNADMVIMCGHYDESVYMRLALKHIAWMPKAYYASVGPALPSYGDRLKADADLSFSSSQWETSVIYGPKDQDLFRKPFKQMYGVEPAYQAATAYAAGQILEKAIKKAQSFDREKIRAILSKMDAMSIIGRYGVDAHGKQIKHFPITIQWQNGKKKIVWPSELATADPNFK